MIDRHSLRSPRSPRMLLVAGGLAFGLLLTALARLVDRGPLWSTFARQMPAGLVWAAMTPAIAAWDRRLRTLGGHVIVAFGHLPMIAIAAVIDTTLRRGLITRLHGPIATPYGVTLLYFADLVTATYIAVVLVARVVATRRTLAERAGHELRLRSQVARAKLEYLEAQLRPHFLFNALSTISELGHDAPARAAEMLRHLGALLRHALDGRRGEEIRLRDELDTLEPYLAITRLRFKDWLDIELHVEPAALDALVPRLVLQPVVENAIRHGLRDRTEPGRIAIHATVHAGRVRLRVIDNGHGIRPGSAPGHGVGLSNIRARLDALYGGGGTLGLSESPAGGAITEVAFPLRHEHLAPGEAPNDRPSSNASSAPSTRTLLGAWAVWGIFLVQQSIAFTVLRGRTAELRVGRMLAHDLGSAALWALLTPVVLLLARVRWPRAIAVHVAGAPTCAFVHATVIGMVDGVDPLQRSGEFWSLVRLDVMIYALLVAAAHLWRFEARVRERDVAAARMRLELEDARLRAATQEIRPDVLLTTLDELATEVQRDPVAAERRLARLGEWLRLTLDGVGERSVCVAHEVAALRAYVELRREPRLNVRCGDGVEDAEVPPGLLQALGDALLGRAEQPTTLRVDRVGEDTCVTWDGPAADADLAERFALAGVRVSPHGVTVRT